MLSNNLRDRFESWLIFKGLSQKTGSGRASTVYEYIRALNLVCDVIYHDHKESEWKQLAHDIYPILGFYLLCKKGKLYINNENYDKIENFLQCFYKAVPYINRDDVEDHFQINLYKNDKLFTSRYVILETFISRLDSTCYIELFINDKDSLKRKKFYALKKFYDFLEGNNYDVSSSSFSESSKNLPKNIRDFYQITSDKLFFLDIQGSDNKLYIETKGGTNKKCPKIIPSKKTDKSLETEVSGVWIQDLLRISRRTLNRLVEDKILNKNENGMFSISEVNAYIQKNFHPSNDAENSKVHECNEVQQWWEVKDVEANTGLNEKYIQRLRKNGSVTYITVSKGKYIYYPYDFTPYSKIKPLIIDEKNLDTK